MDTKILCILAICLKSHVLAAKEDDSLYFDKSKPNIEVNLTAEDFERARYHTVRFQSVPLQAQTTDQDAEFGMGNPNRLEGDIVGIGDIPVTAQNVQMVINAVNSDTAANGNNVQLNAVRSRFRLWENGKVPYTISSQYSSYSKSRIAAAMDEYGKQTCIQFVPRKSERDYLFIEPDDGCYSMVGKARGRQTISLDNGCLSKGVIMHEMMHSVGFFHEQSRADRDNYVDIKYENIMRGMEGQFQKYSLRRINHLGTEYDYGSLMHYGSRSFSRNRQPTIVPKESGARIGQRRAFSSTDVSKLNKLYECRQPAGIVTDGPIVPLTTRRPIITQTPINPINPGALACSDKRFDCSNLQKQGWCSRNPAWSQENCAKSCGLCTGGGNSVVPTPNIPSAPNANCRDENNYCANWANFGFCTRDFFADYLKRNCRRSCNFC